MGSFVSEKGTTFGWAVGLGFETMGDTRGEEVTLDPESGNATLEP